MDEFIYLLIWIIRTCHICEVKKVEVKEFERKYVVNNEEEEQEEWKRVSFPFFEKRVVRKLKKEKKKVNACILANYTSNSNEIIIYKEKQAKEHLQNERKIRPPEIER